MPTNKRITDLTDYTSILPYSSEMFGVYQPMIGWKSKRITKRLMEGLTNSQNSFLKTFAENYTGASDTNFSKSDCKPTINSIEIGKPLSPRLLNNYQSILVECLSKNLPIDKIPGKVEWKNFINENKVTQCLKTTVSEFYVTYYKKECGFIQRRAEDPRFDGYDFNKDADRLVDAVRQLINGESAIAGALLNFAEQNNFSTLENIFYQRPDSEPAIRQQLLIDMINADDPFATFDPRKDIKNVSLSPLGIVHLFRQYFFELDTFLGTPTSHVWLSPGSTVELIEVSTRRIYTEKIIEQSTETTKKEESSITSQDEISKAVKEDNKTDLKLGATLTVNQSWGTGNSTATGSLSMDRTQETAREVTDKRMRQQTEKLSTEIRENFKSTFKTITEITDTSSKRYVLTNSTQDLINYELRRKMRQVGVQVQDIGTYLCWETFVDEPGKQLGLSNLVHIAKPADLVSIPELNKIPYPDPKPMAFTAKVSYNLGNKPGRNGPEGFLPLETKTLGVELPDIPEGYTVLPDSINIKQQTASGYQFQYIEFAWKAKIVGKAITLGVYIDGEYDWENQIDFEVGITLQLTVSSEKIKEIDAANVAKILAHDAATEESTRTTRAAFLAAAKERIEFAANISIRKYEDLREEERIVVYRNLISTLMNDIGYKFDPAFTLTQAENIINDSDRHVLSELLNSIFDIDKMLYFVAPEWWKPRHRHYHQTLGNNVSNYDIFVGNLTSWSDLEIRPDNYFITEKSQYAKMGSSLGWLLQLDGDDLRNAFLNAPWVKAVIPVRPGKELEASNWLQQLHVEGTDGLDKFYQAPEEELKKIKKALNILDVTISDAIKYLCADVASKYKASLKVGRYPKDEINDDNRVSATPINKVYEHGFYPLKGGFKAVVEDDYEIISQWIEVLPTDQVVPVEVKYNPKTGRQV